MAAKDKVDLRFNDVKEAIIEIKKVLEGSLLTNEGLAILIANMPRSGVNKTQVLSVLNCMEKLDKHYLKENHD